jgi:epoxyqueuosine reductase QueG
MGSEISDFLGLRGVTLVGIAGISSLPPVPEEFSPSCILEDATSVICYGVPIPKGVIYADNYSLELYWRYCNMVYRSLDIATNQLCLTLEEHGHRASPIYGCFPWKVARRQFWGFLPLVYWAEQAGLGKLTKCGLVANPRYGTRILFGGVVTNADLPATEKLTQDPCPPGCMDCIKVCPVNAIAETGKVDHNLCIRYSGANPLLTHLLEDPAAKEKFSFETIVNTVGVDDHGAYTCNSCLKVCPLNR